MCYFFSDIQPTKSGQKTSSERGLRKQGNNKENAIDADRFDRPLKPGEEIWIRQLCLTEADRQRITLGKWLNSSLINATQKLLRKKFANEKGLQDTIAKETSWKPVQGEFVQVLHVGKSHWLTVSNKHCSPGTIRVYDSTKGAITADTKNQVAAIMHYKEAEIMFEVMDVDVQINGSDCGLHAVATAYELCAGNDPTGITWEHDQLRSHLQRCLEREAMKPFPRKGQRPSGIVRASFRVPIFCICRMPEGRSTNMARCVKCGEWYHKTCTNIPKTVFSRKREPWACEHCK